MFPLLEFRNQTGIENGDKCPEVSSAKKMKTGCGILNVHYHYFTGAASHMSFDFPMGEGSKKSQCLHSNFKLFLETQYKTNSVCECEIWNRWFLQCDAEIFKRI